ncbi:hypothetical protein Lal_00028316 [Lupinus albus]|nr:hypothetical protein Lal_00028316 [Lupinus albus]
MLLCSIPVQTDQNPQPLIPSSTVRNQTSLCEQPWLKLNSCLATFFPLFSVFYHLNLACSGRPAILFLWSTATLRYPQLAT